MLIGLFGPCLHARPCRTAVPCWWLWPVTIPVALPLRLRPALALDASLVAASPVTRYSRFLCLQLRFHHAYASPLKPFRFTSLSSFYMEMGRRGPLIDGHQRRWSASHLVWLEFSSICHVLGAGTATFLFGASRHCLQISCIFTSYLGDPRYAHTRYRRLLSGRTGELLRSSLLSWRWVNGFFPATHSHVLSGTGLL